MEIPLQPGKALCWAYNGLFIYIFWPQGLGSSGSEVSASCGYVCLVLNLRLPGCRCDGVLHMDGLIGEDKDLTDEDCFTG